MLHPLGHLQAPFHHQIKEQGGQCTAYRRLIDDFLVEERNSWYSVCARYLHMKSCTHLSTFLFTPFLTRHFNPNPMMHSLKYYPKTILFFIILDSMLPCGQPPDLLLRRADLEQSVPRKSHFVAHSGIIPHIHIYALRAYSAHVNFG